MEKRSQEYRDSWQMLRRSKVLLYSKCSHKETIQSRKRGDEILWFLSSSHPPNLPLA
jgi:hypothetical protein